VTAAQKWLMLLLGLALLGATGCGSRGATDVTYYPPAPPLTPPQQLSTSPNQATAGVTFAAAMDLGCANPALTDATPQQIVASPLRFNTGYLPDGFALLREHWSACDERLAAVTRVYQDTSGRQYTISRYTARTYPQTVDVPRQLKEAVAGKPAISIGDRVLILVETFGITVIEGGNFGDLTRIAEGLR